MKRQPGFPPAAAAAALAVLVLAAGCAAPRPPTVIPARPLAPAGTGVIEGRIFHSGNNSLAAPVEVRGAGRATTGGPDGAYILDGLPSGRIFMTAEARDGGKRYLAVAIERLGEGERLARDLDLKDATNVDAFCSECHPERQTRSDQVVRDIHPSDIKPTRANKNVGGVLDARGYVTCESCHTIHEDTGVAHFSRDLYETGELCLKCH